MGAVLTGQSVGNSFAGYSDLEVMCCPTCGVLYAVPERLLDTARDDPDQWWYCCNGHHVHYPGKTEAERLKEKLARERERSARLAAERDQAEAERRGQKAAATRARNQRDRLGRRAQAGVCPCCTRTFKQLRRHMASQHPGYTPDDD